MTSISLLTAIRIPWKVFVAGWIFEAKRSLAGVQDRISSDRSWVDLSGDWVLASMIASTMRRQFFSPP